MSAKSLTANQCNHINARGRRCRMLAASEEDSFCTHHLAQAAVSLPDPENLADELLNSIGDLTTAGEINALLGNVAKLFARKQIDRKDAVAFGYLAQLILCTLPGMEKKLKAQRSAIALEEVNKDIAKMQAHFLAKRAATKAAEAAKKSQNTPATQTKDSAGSAPQQTPSNTPTSAESATPKPPRDYYSMRT